MNWTLVLAAVIGAVIYALIDFTGKHGSEVFTKKYIFVTLVNILAGVALLWAMDLKEGLMQIGWFDAAKVIAMFFGIAGQKLFKTVIDIADKNVKTKLGVNIKK